MMRAAGAARFVLHLDVEVSLLGQHHDRLRLAAHKPNWTGSLAFILGDEEDALTRPSGD